MSEDVHRSPQAERADVLADPAPDPLEPGPPPSKAFRLWTLVGGLVAFALLVQLMLF